MTQWEVIYEIPGNEYGRNIITCDRISYADSALRFHIGHEIVGSLSLTYLIFAHKLEPKPKLAEGGIVKPAVTPWLPAPETEEEVFVRPGRLRQRFEMPKIYNGAPSPHDRIEAAAQELAERMAARPAKISAAMTSVAPTDIARGELGNRCA